MSFLGFRHGRARPFQASAAGAVNKGLAAVNKHLATAALARGRVGVLPQRPALPRVQHAIQGRPRHRRVRLHRQQRRVQRVGVHGPLVPIAAAATCRAHSSGHAEVRPPVLVFGGYARSAAAAAAQDNTMTPARELAAIPAAVGADERAATVRPRYPRRPGRVSRMSARVPFGLFRLVAVVGRQ